MDKEMRLHKYIALCGKASRRKAENLIQEGKVFVNGKLINKVGAKVNPKKDEVKVDGEIIKIQIIKLYIMLNKPKGYITTSDDQYNRPTVMDLIKDIPHRIYPVGRLDYNSEGLLLLTNDGDFTNKVIHPKNSINKTYVAKVDGVPDPKSLDKFRKGLKIDNYITAPADIRIMSKSQKSSILEIKIHEGKNRQVRKMCLAIGHPIKELKRVAIGNLNIGNIEVGKWRKLKEHEIRKIFE